MDDGGEQRVWQQTVVIDPKRSWCNINMMSLLQTWSQSRSCWRSNPQKDPRVILSSHYIITTFIYICQCLEVRVVQLQLRGLQTNRLWNVLRVKDVCGQSNWSSHHINIIQTIKVKGGIEIFWYLFSVTDSYRPCVWCNWSVWVPHR